MIWLVERECVAISPFLKASISGATVREGCYKWSSILTRWMKSLWDSTKRNVNASIIYNIVHLLEAFARSLGTSSVSTQIESCWILEPLLPHSSDIYRTTETVSSSSHITKCSKMFELSDTRSVLLQNMCTCISTEGSVTRPKENLIITTVKLSHELSVTQSTVKHSLKKPGFSSKLCKWIPRRLTHQGKDFFIFKEKSFVVSTRLLLHITNICWLRKNRLF